MPFQYILANLLAENESAVGVLFFDESGEMVDLACAEVAPYDMRVVGAYLGIYLRQLRRSFVGTGAGVPQMLHIERDGLHIHARVLPDGYSLALVQRPPALVAQARRSLTSAVELLEREVFGTVSSV